MDIYALSYFDWPPNGPDLNQIENLWSIRERKQEMDTSSLAKLKAELLKLWKEFPKELLQKLADLFPVCMRLQKRK